MNISYLVKSVSFFSWNGAYHKYPRSIGLDGETLPLLKLLETGEDNVAGSDGVDRAYSHPRSTLVAIPDCCPMAQSSTNLWPGIGASSPFPLANRTCPVDWSVGTLFVPLLNVTPISKSLVHCQ